MKAILAAFFLVFLSSVGFAAQAPALNKMSAEQLHQYFSGKSIIQYDPRFGNSIAYFRPNGTLYIYDRYSAVVGKSKWSVLTEPGRAVLCFAEANQRISAGLGGRLDVKICVEAKLFVRNAVDLQDGDVLGLSKRSKPGYLLDGKKTSFAKLKAGKP